MADKKTGDVAVPATGDAESKASIGEARPESSDLETAEIQLAKPTFGPGSKVNWDNEKNDPNKRKHVGVDPEGRHNVKLLG